MSLRLVKLSFAILAALTSIVTHATVLPTDFAKKIVATPSETALAKIGESTFTDFPVLVRLPAAASAFLQPANGSDLLVTDENDAALPFEVETFNPAGETLVWVKVPSLSASTKLTAYFGGAANTDNDPTNVWTRYAAVFHGGASITNATGHATSVTAQSVSAVTSGGRAGGAMTKNSGKGFTFSNPVTSGALGSIDQFSFSGWFKKSAGSTAVLFSNKGRSEWNGNGFVALVEGGTYFSVGVGVDGSGGHQGTSSKGALVNGTWGHLAFSYDKSATRLVSYFNGTNIYETASARNILDPGKTVWSFGGFQDNDANCFQGTMDELRIFNGVASSDWIALEYATMAEEAFFTYGDIRPVDETAPVFETPTAVRNENGTYTVSVILSENNGAVGVVYDGGAAAITNLIQANATPGTYTDTPSNIPSGTTYAFAAYGKSANGTEVLKSGGVFYNGDLTVETISDAVENGLVPGVFRITRADTAHDLPVAYTVSGTATQGQTYTALSGTATIPAGLASVDIQVVPLLDSDTTSNTTVIVTLDAGLYGISALAGSAELTVVNLAAPTGINTWISPSNSLASIACNWSEGHSPTSSENVLFDGRFSTANCEWDAAATATVASWTQTNGYTGVITLKTVYPGKGDFQCLTVTGAMAIDCGTITHPQSLNSTSGTWLTGAQIQEQEVYRICLDVGGTLTIGANGAIDVKDKGHYQDRVSSINGYGAHAVGYSSLGGAAAYGNPKEPIDIGMGCRGNQWSWVSYPGSGAIRITAGDVVVNGSICANAGSAAYGSHRRFTAAAGSIWIDADSITGSGSITAVAVTPPDGSCGGNGRGSGGSIALWTKTPVTLGSPFVSAGASSSGYNAPGTVFLHDQTMDKGVLVVDGMRSGNPPDLRACANVTTNGDWTFDQVRLQNHGTLSVPAGTTLTLPGGWNSITSTNAVSAANCGVLCYEGGTIDAGTAADAVLSGRWCFTPVSNYVFNANVSLANGAMIGKYNHALNLGNHVDVWSNATYLCSISVAGNLTVDSSSSLSVSLSGFMQNDSGYFPGYGTSSHGGCYGNTSTLTGGAVAYGSIINPILPARAQRNSYYQPGGGALKLTVGGTLALDGQIVSDGYSGGNGGVRGAGGSLNITAGALTGEGSIHANGLSGESGGRVAVRLTNSGATFDDFTGTIMARRDGASKTAPGTVYLQTAADGEGCGTIVVDGSLRSGTASSLATPYTPIPANGAHADNPADLRKCSLEVSNYARIGIVETLKLASLETDSSSVIDLNGKTLTVKSAKLGDAMLSSGEYTAAQLVECGIECVLDSSEGKTGVLKIGGIGFMLFVR